MFSRVSKITHFELILCFDARFLNMEKKYP